MRKAEQMQKLVRYYKDQKEIRGPVETSDVVDWAVRKGLLELPPPIDPRTRLADEMAKALREEIRYDLFSGRPYRANHAVVTVQDGRSRTLWGDIDEESRPFMQKAFKQRRDQIVGDCLQLSLDVDHFNAMHRDDAPIVVPLDFTDDVDERKLSPQAA